MDPMGVNGSVVTVSRWLWTRDNKKRKKAGLKKLNRSCVMDCTWRKNKKGTVPLGRRSP